SVYTGSASARTAAVKSFWSGPPSAIRASGRLESTVRSPYRGLSAVLQVAVTPARTSATMSPRANDADAGSVGETTSATDTARTAWLFVLLASATRTGPRAAGDSPNQPYAGLSSVHGCFAESTASSAAPKSCIKTKPQPLHTSAPSLTDSPA